MFEFIFLVTILYVFWAVYQALPFTFFFKKTDDPSTYSANRDGDNFDQSSSEKEDSQCDVPWHMILQVSENANLDEVTKSYKRLISQYHPDKVESLGEDLRALAERKSKQINSAYKIALNLKKTHR